MEQPGVTQLRASAQDRQVKKKSEGFRLPEPRCGGSATLDGLVTSHRRPEALNKNRCAKICTGSVTWMSEP